MFQLEIMLNIKIKFCKNFEEMKSTKQKTKVTNKKNGKKT